MTAMLLSIFKNFLFRPRASPPTRPSPYTMHFYTDAAGTTKKLLFGGKNLTPLQHTTSF